MRKIFPEEDQEVRVLCTVWDALNQARKKEREALAEELKVVYQPETEGEAKERHRKLRALLRNSLSPHGDAQGGQGLCPARVSSVPSPDPPELYTANSLEPMS